MFADAYLRGSEKSGSLLCYDKVVEKMGLVRLVFMGNCDIILGVFGRIGLMLSEKLNILVR